MKYDFTSVPDRSKCGSMKWDSAPEASTEYVPLSTADMEFPTAPPIVGAIKSCAEKQILGYSQPTEEYYDAVISWQKRRHGFDIKKEWILTTPGVVDALAVIIDAVTKPAESVIILTPAYYPFDLAVTAKSRKIVYSELIDHNGHYEINFNDLRAKAARKEVTALLFCNPHNPTGRVWTREELKRVADICCDNGVFIIDDEIHNDIIMPGFEHTVMATVSKRVLNNIAVCTAPSKTFNLAGLQCSNIIIPNDLARTRTMACSLINMTMQLNVFAYPACIAAYTKCDEWLEEMIAVVQSNADLVKSFMAEHFPAVRVIELEGTYLLWLDVRGLGLTHVEMRQMLVKNHLYLDNGEMFGRAGRGYQRINLACARVTLEKALNRFKDGMDAVYAEWEKNGRPYHKTLKVGDRLEGFVYDLPNGSSTELRPDRSTLIIFSRYYGCQICMATLQFVKGIYPLLKAAGCDVKFVMQSDMRTLAPARGKYPFELIADPLCKLYDRYNVFEADSPFGMILGDKIISKIIGKDVKRILHSGAFEGLAQSLLGDSDDTDGGPRALQLPAFITVDKNLKVTYAHYSKTMADLPNIKEILRGIKA